MKTITLSTELLREARIPRNHWALGADTFPGSQGSLRFVRRYLRRSLPAYQQGMGLVFDGNQSSGKTFLQGFALRCLLAEGFDCFYLTLRELADEMLGKANGEFSVMERLRNADFLALDQIGEKPNKGVEECLREAMKTRIAQRLPTFYGLDVPVERSADASNFSAEYGPDLHNYLVDFNDLVLCRISSRTLEDLREKRLATVS